MHGRSGQPFLTPDRIGVVGVGGAGNRLVNRMAEEWDRGPVTAAVDTDVQTLDNVRATAKVQIGAPFTRGLGAGGDPKVGRHSAEEEFTALCGLLENRDLLLLVAGLGGGTGGGAASVVARAGHEGGALVLGFCLLPFDFESAPVRRNAEQALDELREAADVVVAIPNQRLFGVSGTGSPIEETFRRTNEVLCRGIGGIWRMLLRQGLMNVTLADIRTLGQQAGRALEFGYGEGLGPDRAQAAADAVLTNLLLGSGKALETAGSVLVSVAGDSDLTFGEAEQILQAVAEVVPRESWVRSGMAVDPGLRGRVTVTLLVSGGKSAPGGPPTVQAVMQEQDKGPDAERNHKAGRPTQTQLGFESPAKGRFKDVEPTVYKRENLDVPTYARRGIVLDK